MINVAVDAKVRSVVAEASIEIANIEERLFPGEMWLIATVAPESLATAQSMSGSIEQALNSQFAAEDSSYVVMFRPDKTESPENSDARAGSGRLGALEVDQLIQLLEARSRTSDALPSLRYMEDPRASLTSVGASRHQFIFGRRGVGKTALLLEAKRLAEKQGDITIWLNAHTFRGLSPANAGAVVASLVLSTLAGQGGTSGGSYFQVLTDLRDEVEAVRRGGEVDESQSAALVPRINGALRTFLSGKFVRLFLYLDDFYLYPSSLQAAFLDYVSAILRDCDAWIKIASIERLSRPYEPSTRLGLEIPHDASRIDLDVTLEDPQAAQDFLQSVLVNYTQTAGVGQLSRIAKPEALGRLVLASGGVPRDYLNLFASSIVVARESRTLAREVGREDVAIAAGRSARTKKRDLEQDVAGGSTSGLLTALERLSEYVKGYGFAYFRVDTAEKNHPGYELLALLVDLRFAHLVQSALSDQHRSGVRYEAYILDLSEFADIRLKRGLNLLDLDAGHWNHRLTGVAKSAHQLSAEQLRTRLRRSPIVPMTLLSED